MYFRNALRSLLMLVFFTAAFPAESLPKWTRKYNMPCGGCHTVAPRLNDFGKAFQANYFSIPGSQLSFRRNSLPISGIALVSAERNLSRRESSVDFRNLKLFVVDPLYFGGRNGVYYANPIAVSSDPSRPAWSVDDVYLTLPFAGSRGQWTATAGQWMPIQNQWSPHNLFTRTAPSALQLALDEFSFAGHTPGLRVDYFDRRGEGTADGNYLALGLPFSGHIDFREGARPGSPRGLFAHAFRRRSGASIGGFGYTRGSNWLGGLIATRDLGANYAVWGMASLGEDSGGQTRRLSVEGDRYFGSRLAVTGRLEWLDGSRKEIATVAAVTVFPFKEPIMRATLELTQRKGDRSAALLVRGLF